MSRDRDRPFKNMSASERWALETLQRYQLLRVIARYLGIALIAFVAVALPVYWGAGQQTAIKLFYKVIVEGAATDKLWKGLVVALILLLFWQRASYTRRLQHLGRRTEELERKIDPRRTSSNPRT